MKKSNPFFKFLTIFAVLVACTAAIKSDIVINPVFGYDEDVTTVQQNLQKLGLYKGMPTGTCGEKTLQAVETFQAQNGLTVTGKIDHLTVQKLALAAGSLPSATQSNIYLLARIISAEGRGEPYIGQVAIGAVICNRIEHPSFPDSLYGVIYENGAFTALVDGQFNEPISESAYSAARDALAGWDPSGGAVYYFNPSKTNNAFMHSRPVIKVIGAHKFCS